jgi:very-short-patch-repair endonuclease
MRVHNKTSLKEIRRLLRQKMTLAEISLWDKLRDRKLNGLKFSRQHSIGNYIVDFYCSSKKLIIELDGEIHSLKEVKDNDKERDNVLSEMKFQVIRFSNNEVLFNIKEVLNIIVQANNPVH